MTALGKAVLGMMAAAALVAPGAASADMVIPAATTTDTLAQCSLRSAVISANTNSANGVCPMGTYGDDTIELAANTTYSLTLGAGAPEASSLTGDLDVGTAANGTLTISSPGGAVIDASTLPAGQKDRVIDVLDNASLTLLNVSVRGGTTAAGDNNGGGIRNLGALDMTRGDVSGNNATGGGGGVFSDGDGANLRSVTLSGNHASSNGGGGYKDAGGFHLIDSTVTANTAGNAGGTYSLSGSVTGQNTIVSGNSDTGDDSPNCGGGIFSDGNLAVGSTTGCTYDSGSGDLVGADLKLGALADNGGGTLTHALLTGSAAIDASGVNCDGLDQRGTARPIGPACDIGAFEAALPPTGGGNPPVGTPPVTGKLCPKGKKLKTVKTKLGKKKKKCVKKKKRKKK